MPEDRTMPAPTAPNLELKIDAPRATRIRLVPVVVPLAILAVLATIGFYAYRAQCHFVAMTALRGRGGTVHWDVDSKSLLSGGTTEVHFRGDRDKLNDDDLAQLLLLSNLEHLDLSGCNRITGDGLKYLGRVHTLRELHLDAAESGVTLPAPHLTDADLAQLKDLKQLKVLGLRGTAITDQGLDALRSLHSLEYLDLSATKITTAGLARLKGLPRLKIVRVEGSGVTPEQSAAFQKSAPGFEIMDDTPVTPEMVRMKRGRDY
jgi:hypothetical protein